MNTLQACDGSMFEHEVHLTSKDVKRLDLNSEYLGVSPLQLMENAGAAIAAEIASKFKPESNILILAGPGRNGGDGMVAARHLASRGFKVTLILVGSEANIKDWVVNRNWEAVKNMPSTIQVQTVSDSTDIRVFEADVIVDALLGTGFRGPLKQPILEAVRTLNKSRGFKVSVDIPTGVDSDSGEVEGEAVKADLTVTFHAVKAGFEKAKEYIGEVKVAPIGIPPEADLYTGPGDVETCLKGRPARSKKGDYGRLLVIGGSETYSGAPALVALAALRAGTDLAYVAAPQRTAEAISSISPNLITIKLSGEYFNQANLGQVRTYLDRATAVAVGPGMGLHRDSVEAFKKLLPILQEYSKPTLIDADGLKALAACKGRLAFPAVLTPHAGEFETLSGRKVPDELEGRAEEAKSLACELGAVILLKGWIDVISDGVKIKFNRTGNPGMTVGGTGDVLSGVVAGLMAQGLEPFQASAAGAFINGAAGDVAYREYGPHLVPTDLLENIHKIMNEPMTHRDARYLGG
ncbi:MAG: NAD(P)H-hydrate dehydratase [Candidatus Bathyarchaeia archaeon]